MIVAVGRTGVVRCLLAASVFLSPMAGNAQETAFLGDWRGTLSAGPTSLRLELSVYRDSTGVVAGRLSSRDQNMSSPAAVRVTVDSLVVTIPSIGAMYHGRMASDGARVDGAFSQRGGVFPLVLTRGAHPALSRPQTPRPPYPYRMEEMRVASKEDVVLAGTLVIPAGRGPFPTVVLVTGSGAQDRDESILEHRPFLVLADHLARAGIASFRYDDRGVAGSTGKFSGATTRDFAADARAAVHLMTTRREVDSTRLGILGHSEGGLVAAIVAAEDAAVKFIVSLAGPGVRGDSALWLQHRALLAAEVPTLDLKGPLVDIRRRALRAALEPDSTLAAARVAADSDSLPPFLRFALTEDVRQLRAQLRDPWLDAFLRIDPSQYFRRVRVPVLAINGSKDLQVTPRENLEAIRAALVAAGNPAHVEHELPGLNHLFQPASTGLPREYGTIEQTMDEGVLAMIARWILQLRRQPFR